MNLSEIVFKYKNGTINWENTGLLDSLAKDQKPQLIEIFNQGMKYINEDGDKEQLILPILFRIYAELVNGSYSNAKNKHLLWVMIDVDDAVNSFIYYYDKLRVSFDTFKNIDPQLEFCVLAARDYNMKLNKILREKYSSGTLQDYLLTLNRDKKINSIL